MIVERRASRPDGPQRGIRSRSARGAVVGGLAAAFSVAAPIPVGASPPRSPVSTATVAGLGTVLVSGHRPVYVFTSDSHGHSSCSGACAAAWPPLLVSAKAAHHLGHLRGLGTIRRPDRRLQVVLFGRPLYFYVGDHSLNAASGQGVVNRWFVIRPNGTLVRTVGSAQQTTVPSSTPAQPPAASSPAQSVPAPASTGTMPTRPGMPATGPPPATPTPSAPPVTSPPPPSPPPTTTTTTAPSGGGVSF